MLIWTARVSKKTKAVVAVILAGILAAAVLLLVGRSGGGQDAAAWQLTGNADRIAYLESMGWQVEEEPVETLQFLLPEKLEEPYLTYNELQDSQGFDLSACCGKQVARYTYTVTNYPGRPEGVQANLYVCEGQPVISSAPGQTDSRTHWSIRSRTEPVRNGLRAKKELPQCGSSFSWLKNQASVISVTAPEPTVRPPSRIAKRRPFSMAMGVISSTLISTLSPGMHISVPSGRVMTPVTSVVRK